MSASVASPSVLLKRVLSLREATPFLLACDTFVQSASLLTNELIHTSRQANPDIVLIYLSFETPTPPSFVLKNKDYFLDLLEKDPEKTLKSFLESPIHFENGAKRKLFIIDSLNYIQHDKVVDFLKLLMQPNHTVYGIYHQDFPLEVSGSKKGPSTYSYLHYLSSCVFDVKSLDHEDTDSTYYKTLINGPTFPVGVRTTQRQKFFVHLTYRRKSGRSLDYKFVIDSSSHEYENVSSSVPTTQAEDESLLTNLTTFNLNTTQKQKEQREKVDLPFLEAQQSMGSVGASIVYEFEKDDDYDEEDPYEEPF